MHKGSNRHCKLHVYTSSIHVPNMLQINDGKLQHEKYFHKGAPFSKGGNLEECYQTNYAQFRTPPGSRSVQSYMAEEPALHAVPHRSLGRYHSWPLGPWGWLRWLLSISWFCFLCVHRIEASVEPSNLMNNLPNGCALILSRHQPNTTGWHLIWFQRHWTWRQTAPVSNRLTPCTSGH